MSDSPLAFFEAGDGPRIAYRLRPGGTPTLLFLPGYASDMEGAKALAIDGFAAGRGLGCLRFDYSGTGSSEGEFAKGTLDRWLTEALSLIDALTAGPLIVIGSSMGAWIALHVALRRLDRVAALVGIAAAPDFTDWGFTAADKATLIRDGQVTRARPYGGNSQVTHRGFWHSGESLRLLGGPIATACPVRLVHGDRDTDVPADVAIKLLAALGSADVQLCLIKGGGHRLSERREIETILRTVAEMTETMK